MLACDAAEWWRSRAVAAQPLESPAPAVPEVPRPRRRHFERTPTRLPCPSGRVGFHDAAPGSPRRTFDTLQDALDYKAKRRSAKRWRPKELRQEQGGRRTLAGFFEEWWLSHGTVELRRSTLVAFRRAFGDPGYDQLVFPHELHGGLWLDEHYRTWRRRIYLPSAENVGLPRRRPYDLRHTWTSLRIAEKKLSIAELAEQLGDKTSTVLDTYTHVMNEWRVRAGLDVEAEIRRARRGHGQAAIQEEDPPCTIPLISDAASTALRPASTAATTMVACSREGTSSAGLTAARKEEADRYTDLMRRAVPLAVMNRHEPAVLIRDGDEVVCKCDRCAALGYGSAEEDIIGGELFEDDCPTEEDPRPTALGFMYYGRG